MALAEAPSATVDGAPREVYRSILVAGGGIAGITAAVEAAEVGYDVYIVERQEYLGGRVAQLYKYFPKLCPPYCGLEINFQRIRNNHNIRFFTLAEIETISGEPGAFDVTVKVHPRYVNDRCTTCGVCAEVCPVDRPNAFNFGMDTTKAIYLPHEMAFPMKYAIDDSTCKLEQCAKCVEVCPYGAIDLSMKPRTVQLKVGAIVMATGWKPYEAARLDNLAFGTYKNVISNVMMERMAAANGPTKGQIVRPSDGQPARRVAFVQCAGSRDHTHLGYCSSICCLASLKQATYVREQIPDSQVHIFYIDLRTPGGYEGFAQRVRADDRVSIIKGKVAKVLEDPTSGDLVVEAEDILAQRKMLVTVDLLVLATGMSPSLDAVAPAGLVRDGDHFLSEQRDGIFAAGCARAPVDVATATQDATAAAMRAIGAIQMAARR
ncbi:MAG: FAD-dependent oxidoreductase [Chloroflexota bacterium]